MRPYFYKIKHNATGRYYVGCQYGRKSNPDDLLVRYFTSSWRVKEIIAQESVGAFTVVRIDARSDAREYEANYLSRIFKRLGRQKFIELFINRNLAPGIVGDAETFKKISTATKAYRASHYHASMAGKKHSIETRDRISIAKINYFKEGGNHPKGMLNKHHTQETKEKMSLNCARTLTGKKGDEHPVGGTKWFNNGTHHMRCIEHPGEGWTAGRIFKERNRSK